MKKTMLTAMAVMAFVFLNAQETKFGLKGGANLSTLTGDTQHTSLKAGFHVGGFAEFKLSDKFSIQPEVLYSTQGTKEKGSGTDFQGQVYEIELNYKLAYINVPILAKYYVAEKFSLEAGPQIGFLVAAKRKYTAPGVSEEDDVKKDFGSIDFGVDFGAGYDLTEKFSVGLRYNLGLTNLHKDIDYYKIKNSVFSLSAGYKF
ncbi:PorT family protein [Flavobacterium sp. ANB]|uniref:porin family protein n=1 Tax=unclassified Flavobacterium TaxID=196869 RepID=UPI0012B864F9|nr:MULTISPECIES: porin family protein [unclassified Flavobacterium]MBF4518860.1 PorT family protein [Flavobacterium sp. ANB]MTD71427.1 outer membrane beta-barrel protein [Flavobacterium sp. LC2016-13]